MSLLTLSCMWGILNSHHSFMFQQHASHALHFCSAAPAFHTCGRSFIASSMGLSIGLPYFCVGMEFLLFKCWMCPDQRRQCLDCRVGVLWMFHHYFPIPLLPLRQYMVTYYFEGNTIVTSRTRVFPKYILKSVFFMSSLVFTIHSFLLWYPLLKNNALGSENISFTCTDESNMRYFFRWGELLFLNSWMLFWF